MSQATAFAGYPSVVMYQGDGPDKPPKLTTAVQHLLWGDYLKIKSEKGSFYWVASRGEEGWVEKQSVQTKRLLEMVFVDVGQGDGCLIVTPDDKWFVVDAGVGDNLYRFLRWRFGRFQKPVAFEAAIISHPDEDHYGGFEALFADTNVTFNTVYHNGIMERKGEGTTPSLGAQKKVGKVTLLTDIVRDHKQLKAFLGEPAAWKGKAYATMLDKALAAGRFPNSEMLWAGKELPGYGQGADLVIQVLGPVLEPTGEGQGLRAFGSVGKTKNGHSIVLRLVYDKVSILIGGDLNIPAEQWLLGHHTGLPGKPKSLEDERLLVEAARRIFRCDVAKSCHHGSADFSETYLKALDPIATVISSGDDEPHAHPRADTLGAIGRWARGGRPLIFSTELARSAKEAVKSPYALRQQLREAEKNKDNPELSEAKRSKAAKEFDRLVDSIDRSIAVYGAINLRTDGDKVVLAYKIENPRTKDRKWDIYQLERTGEGPLTYSCKHEA